MDKLRINKKKLLIILFFVVIFSGLSIPEIVFFVKKANNKRNIVVISEKLNTLFSEKNLEINKITLFDSYDKAIKVFGKPLSVSNTLSLTDIKSIIFISKEKLENCQFLHYKNFFLIIENGKVKGWYLNPEIKENKNSSFYLPTLKRGESKTFLDFYKSWENLFANTYKDNFSKLKEFDFGEIYFCMFYTDKNSNKENLMFNSENETYKIRQSYAFVDGILTSKSVEALDEKLINNPDNYASMFLGKSEAYVKKCFPNVRIKFDKEFKLVVSGKKIKTFSFFTKDSTFYQFSFDPITLKCSEVEILPNAE